MKKQNLLTILLLFLSAAAGCVYAQLPSTRVYDGAKLAKVKARQQAEAYAPAIARLMKEADKALKQQPVSVMDKEIVAASGDKHDYLSMGPYWWPDPSKPDGLPYIRKAGVRNPNATSDRSNLGKTIKNIQTLGIAYYFSGREPYAAKAAELVRVWFINPETRMNPNMNYAQMIPGHNGGKGRGFGMIDVYPFIEMLDAVELMNSSAAFTEADRKGLKTWFGEFMEWIRTSPTANEERTAKNNHGLAFDVQTTVYALFTGDSQLARKLVNEFAGKRLYPQIEPDGKQPLELARTTGFGYTNFNLVHMMDMCAICKTLGVDLYPSTSPDGRSIAKALAYMASFVGKPLSDFPYQQIKNWDGEQQRSCWILRRASFYDAAAGWDDLSSRHMKSDPTDRNHLLYSRE